MATNLKDKVLTLGDITLTNDGTKIDVSGNLKATKVFNAVWNDIVDALDVPDEVQLDAGYVYAYNDEEGFHKTNKLGEMCALGVHSDTYGYGLGYDSNKKQLLVAVGGFVLAYIDNIYPSGTPLTCKEGGILTEASDGQIVLGRFFKKETSETVYNGQIEVKGRHWIKVY